MRAIHVQTKQQYAAIMRLWTPQWSLLFAMACGVWFGVRISYFHEALSSPDRQHRQAVERSLIAPQLVEDDRPPLSSYVVNKTLVGDVQSLLDFAILGFGKCGTSTMMVWLREHPEVQAFGKEIVDLMHAKPHRLVGRLYNELPAGPYKRGYKSPQDVSQPHVMNYYRTLFPKTKLIIGIRHPVRWFESLYNFRVQNLSLRKQLPPPNDLIGGCTLGRMHTCTSKGDFGLMLMNLGKRSAHSTTLLPIEQKILSRYPRYNISVSTLSAVPNPLFLFELDQLGDDNAERSERFRDDMSAFLELKEPLPVLPKIVPGKKHASAEQQRRNALKIRICDDKHAPARRELMRLARTSSIWIRTVLLVHPTVTVSSPGYFDTLMKGWMVDPCEQERETRESAGETIAAPT